MDYSYRSGRMSPTNRYRGMTPNNMVNRMTGYVDQVGQSLPDAQATIGGFFESIARAISPTRQTTVVSPTRRYSAGSPRSMRRNSMSYRSPQAPRSLRDFNNGSGY